MTDLRTYLWLAALAVAAGLQPIETVVAELATLSPVAQESSKLLRS